MRGKLETGQLESRPASWKLDKLEISGQAHELELLGKLEIF